ncbi:MAG TPA: ATP-binding protein [Pyrinomonadaceae bacterium]|nr:ATP-binding protein [Pyrinomonadaceae bacterium]
MFLRFKFLIFLMGAVAAGVAAGLGRDWLTGALVFISLATGAGFWSLLSRREEGGWNVASSGHQPFLVEQKRKSEVAGARAGALIEAMMDGMREGMLVVDEEMRIIASNRAAIGMFAAGGAKLEGRRLTELTRSSAIHFAFATSIVHGGQAGAKVEMQGPGGPIFDLRVVPLRLDDGKSRGAIGVFFDITRLERLERVRQEFLSNVSHELRTPLTAIIAFVETLEDGAIADQTSNRRFLSIIRKNAERMHNLIDDILELSAIEAGTVEVKPEPVRLHSLVGDVLTALLSRAETRGVTLKNEVPVDVFVFADARRLEQMLTNLVDNAIKFNHEGGFVTVGHEREGGRDRIHVTDTGDGISPEHIKRIFERFYRVDRARSREMGGTGLGLAIVKHLARAHGGEVSVQSTPSEGATFVIELPVGEVEEAESSQAILQASGQDRASQAVK